MLPETSKVSTTHGCQWKQDLQSKRVYTECNHSGEKALNGIAVSWVKSSAQHAAADKGRNAALFEEEGFENNPENIMMLCSKATVGLRLEYCSLVGSSLLLKKEEDREKGRIKVWMRKV